MSSLALAAAPAAAQDPSADPADPALDEVETTDRDVDPQSAIIVTGTRRVDRTVADSPVPIDVISSEALSQSGFTETNRLLRELVPSFNFPQPSITDGTDVIRPATLRGLSPDQTLVLINGKRRHTTALLNINGSVGRGSAAVDINLIPSIALSRVEVLRDGAAAQYGSDAIAGRPTAPPSPSPARSAFRSGRTATSTSLPNIRIATAPTAPASIRAANIRASPTAMSTRAS